MFLQSSIHQDILSCAMTYRISICQYILKNSSGCVFVDQGWLTGSCFNLLWTEVLRTVIPFLHADNE